MEIINLLRDIGIFGLAMFFIQLLLTKSADRKYATFQTELDHKTKEFQATLHSKLELYKSELNFKNYKSTQIYEKQLNSIFEMHQKLSKLNRAMQEMTAFMKLIQEDGEEEEKERIKNAGEAYNEFMLFYTDNLIFLPTRTIEQLNEIRDDYWNSFNDYTFGRLYGIKDKFTYEKSKEAGDRVRQKIQPALEKLRNDFRELIGVE